MQLSNIKRNTIITSIDNIIEERFTIKDKLCLVL